MLPIYPHEVANDVTMLLQSNLWGLTNTLKCGIYIYIIYVHNISKYYSIINLIVMCIGTNIINYYYVSLTQCMFISYI